MSYSRWTNSEFYTFWSGSGAAKKEDEEFCCMFSLDSAPHFSYNEVKDMIGIYYEDGPNFKGKARDIRETKDVYHRIKQIFNL